MKVRIITSGAEFQKRWLSPGFNIVLSYVRIIGECIRSKSIPLTQHLHIAVHTERTEGNVSIEEITKKKKQKKTHVPKR